MIDKYYRKVIKTIDDTKYELQLGLMTLKINGTNPFWSIRKRSPYFQ